MPSLSRMIRAPHASFLYINGLRPSIIEALFQTCSINCRFIAILFAKVVKSIYKTSIFRYVFYGMTLISSVRHSAYAGLVLYRISSVCLSGMNSDEGSGD